MIAALEWGRILSIPIALVVAGLICLVLFGSEIFEREDD